MPLLYRYKLNQDLAAILGYKSRVSDIFRNTGKLNLKMIHKLNEELNIPLENSCERVLTASQTDVPTWLATTKYYTPEVADYHHNMKLTDAYIEAYPSSAPVALSGTDEHKISQIITQKYLAGFLQGANYAAWYEHRRTGYPEFTLNPTTNLNTPTTQFPLR